MPSLAEAVTHASRHRSHAWGKSGRYLKCDLIWDQGATLLCLRETHDLVLQELAFYEADAGQWRPLWDSRGHSLQITEDWRLRASRQTAL